jgi:hypothetical protein
VRLDKLTQARSQNAGPSLSITQPDASAPKYTSLEFSLPSPVRSDVLPDSKTPHVTKNTRIELLARKRKHVTGFKVNDDPVEPQSPKRQRPDQEGNFRASRSCATAAGNMIQKIFEWESTAARPGKNMPEKFRKGIERMMNGIEPLARADTTKLPHLTALPRLLGPAANQDVAQAAVPVSKGPVSEDNAESRLAYSHPEGHESGPAAQTKPSSSYPARTVSTREPFVITAQAVQQHDFFNLQFPSSATMMPDGTGVEQDMDTHDDDEGHFVNILGRETGQDVVKQDEQAEGSEPVRLLNAPIAAPGEVAVKEEEEDVWMSGAVPGPTQVATRLDILRTIQQKVDPGAPRDEAIDLETELFIRFDYPKQEQKLRIKAGHTCRVAVARHSWNLGCPDEVPKMKLTFNSGSEVYFTTTDEAVIKPELFGTNILPPCLIQNKNIRQDAHFTARLKKSKSALGQDMVTGGTS